MKLTNLVGCPDRADGKFQIGLVYSTEIKLETAIKNWYMLGLANRVRDI